MGKFGNNISGESVNTPSNSQEGLSLGSEKLGKLKAAVCAAAAGCVLSTSVQATTLKEDIQLAQANTSNDVSALIQKNNAQDIEKYIPTSTLVKSPQDITESLRANPDLSIDYVEQLVILDAPDSPWGIVPAGKEGVTQLKAEFVLPGNVNTRSDLLNLTQNVFLHRADEPGISQIIADYSQIIDELTEDQLKSVIEAVNSLIGKTGELEQVNNYLFDKNFTGILTINSQTDLDNPGKLRALAYSNTLYIMLDGFKLDTSAKKQVSIKNGSEAFIVTSLSDENRVALSTEGVNFSDAFVQQNNEMYNFLLENVEPAVDYYSNMLHIPKTPENEATLLELGDIVRKGIAEQVQGMLVSEKFTTGKWGTKPQAWKDKMANKFTTSRVDKFFKGALMGGADSIVEFSPNFADELLKNETSLRAIAVKDIDSQINELSIAQSDASIAQSDASIAQSNAKIAQGNAKIAQGNAKIAQGNVKIAQGNAKIKNNEDTIKMYQALSEKR